MQLINIPAEQTTAFTDLLLCIFAIAGVIRIYHSGRMIDSQKVAIWSTAFIFLGIAALLGAIAHGIQMPEDTNKLIWQPLNLFLGLSVAFFVIGVIYDLQGYKIKRKVVYIIILISIVFFLITVILPGLFFVFIIYEGIAMLFSLASYTFLGIKRKLPGSSSMSLGILISVIAAIVQTIDSINLHFIWHFDHNGLFHIIQIAGLVFIFSGIIKELKSRKT